MHTRWMIRRDMVEVLQIENLSFKMPWSEEDFVKVLRQRRSVGRVVEIDEKVAGYMIYNLNKNHFEILNFAVHPDYRRQGVAEKMINHLKDKLTIERRRSIFLKVADFNLDMQLFLRSQGMRAVGVKDNHYDDDSSAYTFRYHMIAESPVNECLDMYTAA